jgi:hypothetical protein
MRSSVRTAEELRVARYAGYEKVSLVLGRAAEKIIRSKRAIIATRVRLAALDPDHERNPLIG